MSVAVFLIHMLHPHFTARSCSLALLCCSELMFSETSASVETDYWSSAWPFDTGPKACAVRSLCLGGLSTGGWPASASPHRKPGPAPCCRIRAEGPRVPYPRFLLVHEPAGICDGQPRCNCRQFQPSLHSLFTSAAEAGSCSGTVFADLLLPSWS